MEAPLANSETLRPHGRPLDPGVAAELGDRFGADLSHVRVHTDAHASASALRLGAAAYTHRSDIVFAPHEYQPHTSAGRLLLAHELAHVVQLRGTATGSRVGSISHPSDAQELAADRAAHAVRAGVTALAPFGHASATPGVLRQVKADPFDALRTGTPVTGPQAEAMIRHYGTL